MHRRVHFGVDCCITCTGGGSCLTPSLQPASRHFLSAGHLCLQHWCFFLILFNHFCLLNLLFYFAVFPPLFFFCAPVETCWHGWTFHSFPLPFPPQVPCCRYLWKRVWTRRAPPAPLRLCGRQNGILRQKSYFGAYLDLPCLVSD